MSDPLAQLEARIGHTFRDRTLLTRAVTHSSFAQEHPGDESNQRLEFLGDAVLQILLAEELYKRFPTDREGFLSRKRALLVNGPMLALLAREVGLDACLRLGASEEMSSGRTRVSSLGDAFEALIGAVYLDSDLPTVHRVAFAIFGDIAARLASTEEADNPKGRLQELIQPLHGNHALRYETLRTEGVEHAREYEVAVYLLDRIVGTGRGSSKKHAEEAAARVALATLRAESP